MFHYIFDYNYGNFWQILLIFLLQETGMNTLPNVYKLLVTTYNTSCHWQEIKEHSSSSIVVVVALWV